MSRVRALLIATASTLALTAAGALGAAVTGASDVSSPSLVNATSWSSSDAASASGPNDLASVSCTTSTFCMAVGTQNLGAGGGTLAEVWNGSSWSTVPSPNVPGSSGDGLVSVACVGTTFCLAVGGSNFGGAVAEAWNGTDWSLVTPATPSALAELTSVGCASVMSCEILGRSGNNEVFGNQWNGSALTAVPAQTPPTSGSYPTPVSDASSIDCTSASWCLAVGDTDVQLQSSAPFSEVWNGSAWTLVTTPQPSTGIGSLLRSLSCAGPSFCQAVGQNNTGSLAQTLVETWNGSSWAITPGANTSPSVTQNLRGVDCFSATTCSAVGTVGSGSTLAEVWNGRTWSIVPNTPQAGTSGSPLPTSLAAVSCVTEAACTAVGWYQGSVTQPFAMSASIARSGYRLVAADGGVFNYGTGAPFFGSMGGQHLNEPVVGMAVMPAGDGYYLVASDGGIFNYGSAQFYGSTGSMVLNKPVVGMAMTADGAGYWLVASDGGIFSYGDAEFYGSTGNLHLNQPVVGMASTPDGKGYYLVASDGGIFAFGDAQFYGSTGSLTLNRPVVGMSVPASGGYYLVASDGGIFTFPTASGPPFEGSTGSLVLNKPIVGMTTVSDGYYLAGSDGGVFTFPNSGGPTFYGSTGSTVLNAPIAGIAG